MSVVHQASFSSDLNDIVTNLIKEDNRLHKKKNVPSINIIPLKNILDVDQDRLSLTNLEESIDREDYTSEHAFFELGYTGHVSDAASFTQREQAIPLLQEAFEKKDHQHIIDALQNTKSQMLFIYFVYRCYVVYV